jgi:hypothetical protein
LLDTVKSNSFFNDIDSEFMEAEALRQFKAKTREFFGVPKKETVKDTKPAAKPFHDFNEQIKPSDIIKADWSAQSTQQLEQMAESTTSDAMK